MRRNMGAQLTRISMKACMQWLLVLPLPRYTIFAIVTDRVRVRASYRCDSDGRLQAEFQGPIHHPSSEKPHVDRNTRSPHPLAPALRSLPALRVEEIRPAARRRLPRPCRLRPGPAADHGLVPVPGLRALLRRGLPDRRGSRPALQED